MTYVEKLRDPRWQKRRLEILARDDWTCQWCMTAEETLVVHHLYYQGEPWEAPDGALITLCEFCHDEETTERPVADRSLVAAFRRLPFGAKELAHIAKSVSEARWLRMPEVVVSAIVYALTHEDVQQILLEAYFAAIRRDHSDVAQDA